MAKPIIYKCRYCGKEVDSTVAYSVEKGQHYCNENHYLSHLEKKKHKGGHSYKSAIGTDRRDYTDYLLNEIYIKEGFRKTFPNWQMVMSQTNNILSNNPKWTYETIKYIVWYMKEILELQLITKESNWSPLSLVEFYAKDAEEFCVDSQRVAESAENYDFNEKPIIIENSCKHSLMNRKKIKIEEI